MSSNQHSRQNNRQGRHNNKQNNRGRNQGGRNQRKGGANRPSQQPLTATRQVDSHGPAGKLRGNVKQLYDQYNALFLENRTRDRTASEDYGQYAHHYYTLHSEFAEVEAAQQAQRENEKAKKANEATENQSQNQSQNQSSNESNIVPTDDVNQKPSGKSKDDVKGAAPKKSTRAKPTKIKESPQASLELPLEEKEMGEKPIRKAAIRKPRKVKDVKVEQDLKEGIKEEVAE